MEHNKEVAKHDDLNINGTTSDERRITRMRNCRLVMEDGTREDINEKADAFIKNFRHQLKIQHQDSLKRFQERISRGV
jgi:erythromycin esterase-like protein